MITLSLAGMLAELGASFPPEIFTHRARPTSLNHDALLVLGAFRPHPTVAGFLPGEYFPYLVCKQKSTGRAHGNSVGRGVMSPSSPQRAAHLTRLEPAHTGVGGTREHNCAATSLCVSDLPFFKAAGGAPERLIELAVEVPAGQGPFCPAGQGAGHEEQGGVEADGDE